MMRILLHICCAPCALYSVDRLRQDGHKVSGLFYNPNIHPFSEYKLRQQAVRKMSKRMKLEVFYPDYDIERFFRHLSYNEDFPLRCRNCWQMRLRKTARFAYEKGYGAFTTTLLISPYQDHEALKDTGRLISEEEDVAFHYVDLRPGFRRSQQLAKKDGLYRQKYCGCMFSEREKHIKVTSNQIPEQRFFW